jgi:hypothetical protein
VPQIKSILGVSILFFIASCGVSQVDYEKVRSENESLRLEIDELKNGEARLVAAIDSAYSEKNYSVAKSDIESLNSKHPESKKNAEYRTMLVEIDRVEAAEKLKMEADEKEKKRLANLDNTGIWEVKRYVDDFGAPTKVRYITTSQPVRGTFSNTSNQNSPLNVVLIVDGPSNISIQLYKYAGSNPAKEITDKNYKVSVKDRDGETYRTYATSAPDRLIVTEPGAKQLYATLMKGGEVHISIQNLDITTDEYQFVIDNADWFDNAYQRFASNYVIP